MPQYFFLIALLASVIFLLALLKTDFALIILIFSMLLSPEFGVGGTPGHAVVIRFDDLLMFTVFFGWLAKMAINKDLGLLRVTPLNRPIIFYIAVCVLATLFAAMQGIVVIKYSFFYLVKYIEYFLLFFMIANNIKTIDQTKKFIFFILLTAFFVCIYAWSQIPTGERLTAPFEGSSREGEPNTFAGYLLLMMSLTLGLALYTESKKRRLLLFGLMGFMFLPFMLTLSRGGWISFLPMFLTFVIINKKFRLILLLAFIVSLILLFYFAPQKLRARVEETFVAEKTYNVYGKKIGVAESAAARIDSWSVGFENWLKRPIFGYGIPYGTVIDNQYMRVLTETGCLGFMAFLWLLMNIFRLGWRTFRNAQGNGFVKGLSLGFIAGFVGILFHSFSSADFIIIRIMEPFWLLAALTVTLPDMQAQAAGNDSK